MGSKLAREPLKWEEAEDEAWEQLIAGNPRQAKLMAEYAISLNPDAVDSFVILAQIEPALGIRLALIREAVRIGKEMFAEEIEAGDSESFPFWGILCTRPFIRALHALALLLRTDERDGAIEESIDVAQFLLRICPTDNVGIRRLLPGWLAAAGRWAEGFEMLDGKVEDDFAEMSMWLALFAFQAGKKDLAETSLRSAHRLSPFLAREIVKVKAPKATKEKYIVVGSQEEAKQYAHHAHALWHGLPGAIPWVKALKLNVKQA